MHMPKPDRTPATAIGPTATDPGRRRVVAAAAGLGTALLAPSTLRAQARFPERPITVYGPLPAGGLLDQHLRFLGEHVGKKLGQPVNVAPKPGAGGTIAPTMLAKEPPDGHNLACLLVNSLRYPHYQKTNYDPLADYTYIIGLSNFTFGVAVRADSPYKTIEDLIAAGRASPGKLSSGSTGVGGTGHLLLIEMEQVSGAKFTQVPFKGGPDAVAALLGGHIDFVTDGTFYLPLVKEGKARMLAFATEQRVADLPDVPTLRERGFDAVGLSPYGIVGPKGMSPALVKTLHDAFHAAMKDPAHDGMLRKWTMQPWYRNSADYRKWAEDYFVAIRPTLVKAGLVKT